ncbi:MAG: Sapep family Mn(2+)-dependent dipeptidase [Oscillospiraceae bacterium]|nr:Sapep family Mn(2+)-dependent dipeptidase [Oscillospiraceae bacterium]
MMQEQIKAYFEAHREEMIADVMTLVRIPSVRGEAAPGMPYGAMPRRALETAMNLCREAGFSVQCYDERVMAADFQPGARAVDLLAHLDVVPAADNWTKCDPFDPKIVDGNLYGRGTQDDKGPAVAALYAMKCIKALKVPMKNSIRLVLGTDEECGCGDLASYYAAEQPAPMTISPDANYPLINVERGRLWLQAQADAAEDSALPRIVSAQCGDKANVVPSRGVVVLAGLSQQAAQPVCDAVARATGAAFSLSEQEALLTITCTGANAHAATPWTGNNALTALLQLLSALPLADTDSARRVRALSKLFPHGDWRGKAIGVEMEDATSGKLTLTLNVLSIADGRITATMDGRVPLCANEENCSGVIAAALRQAGFAAMMQKNEPVHYVPQELPLIGTLLRVYEQWTGQKGECLAIGGGTYVHDVENGVAFGCEMPGVDYHIHDCDEFIPVSELLLAGEMLTSALIALANLDDAAR